MHELGTHSRTNSVTISLADETFDALANNKINGQKAFMSGKLKVKGNSELPSSSSSFLLPPRRN